MGVYHFMGMGLPIGPVTCAVDYIEQCLRMIREGNASEHVSRIFSGTGGISHEECDKGKIEAIVIFTSGDVIKEDKLAYSYRGCSNPKAARSEIENRLRDVWSTYDHDQGRKIFWCEVDIDNFQDCYWKACQVAQRFAPVKKQGKEIWCNLTGGANPIGQALHSMSSRTAASVKNYIISQRKDYREEWRVPREIVVKPNHDGYWSLVPFVKMLPDANFYEVLCELEIHEQGISTGDLFDRLRGSGSFSHLCLDVFRRKIALKLHALDYTNYDQCSDNVSISAHGKNFLATELSGYFDNDVSETNTSDVDIVTASKSWHWLHEVNLDKPK